MRMFKILLGAPALCVLAAMPALADDFKVYQPRIEPHEFAAEANTNFSSDHRHAQDNYVSEVAGVEYGINDYWKTELSGEFERENGAGAQLANLKWENVIAPWKPGENFVDTGFYLEAEKAVRDGEPNNIEAKLLLEKDIGNFDNTANLILSRNFGPNSESGIGSGFALQTKYRLDPKFEPGLEYYADTGDITNLPSFSQQDHRFGPVFSGRVGHVKYDAGALFGVSGAADDTTVKVNLEYEFK